MSAIEIAVAVVLALAVLIALLSAVGALVMRDPLQRLHYLAPPASLSAFLIVIAAVLQNRHDWQGALKIFGVAVLLLMINAIVTHATARAALRQMGAKRLKQVPPRVPLVDLDGQVIGEADIGRNEKPGDEVAPWT